MDGSFKMRVPAQYAPLLLLAPLILLVLADCGTLPNGRTWGQDAIYPLDLGRIGQAAYHAAIDLQTLIPAAAGAAVTPFDHKVSDWARAHTPVYGSQSTAANVDTAMLTPLQYEWIATALATPSGDSPGEWIYDKARGMAVEWSAQIANANATSVLKRAIGRERPDKADNQSMPSSASSEAFTYTSISNRNLGDMPYLPDALRVSLQAGNIVAASGVGWARVEAGEHYPSDVLAGAALGHFLTEFVCQAFLGLPEGAPMLSFAPSKKGAMVGLSFAW